MFEAQVAYYLNNYLGKYVYGLDPQSLKISVFKGDVVLRNLKLKPEALGDLDLPITVKSGLLGSLTLKVPWASLGRSPVIVVLDRLYILAGQKADNLAEEEGEGEDGDLTAAERALKRRRVHDAEVAWTSEKFKLDPKKPPAQGGRFRAIIDTVVGNLQLSITNIHIRFEDDVSSGQSFACGLTLEKLTAHTVDEDGKKTFVTSNPMELLRKGSKMQRLALYFDVGTDLWRPGEDWANLPVDAWDKHFQPGISSDSSKAGAAPSAYVLQPIDGQLTYLRRGQNVRNDDSQAVQEVDLQIDAVSLQVTKGQYLSLHGLLEQFSALAARQPNSHLRPKGRPKKGVPAVKWWKYATAAVLRQSGARSMPWKQLSKVVSLRKKYVPAYVKCLQSNKLGGDEEIEAMDADLPEHTILVFRRLAHTKVEREKRRAAAQAAAEYQKASQNQSWLGWMWGGGKGSGQKQADATEERADLTEEEYNKLEEMVSEQEAAVQQSEQSPHSLQMEVRLKVGSSNFALEDEQQVKAVRAGMEGLWLTAQKYPETLTVAASLDGVGLVSPEGTIAQAGAELQLLEPEPVEHTGVPEIKTEDTAAQQALDLEFIQQPQDGRADTVLNITLAPSYVTYNGVTVQRILNFFHTEEVLDFSAISAQAVAQVEKARQAAQQQLAAALQQKPKLALRLFMEAPKIAIPVPASADGQGKLTLVVDLGTFLVETDTRTQSQLSPEEAALYECLRLEGRDISSYLVDGDFAFAELERRLQDDGKGHSNLDLEKAASAASVYIPLLERTGITAAVQAARLPHSKLPKLRSQLRLPGLRFYFSPARVRRVMRVLRSALPEASGSEGSTDALARAAWRVQAEREGPLRVLQWGGIGYSTAKWSRKYAVLHKGQLHILEGRESLTPLQSQTLYINRRITHLPAEAVGGIQNVVAICPPDVDSSKAAESNRCLLLRLQSSQEADAWLAQLTKSAENMKELAGNLESHPLGIDLDAAETESLTSSLSREELHKVASNLSQAEAAPPPTPIQIQASLGELALFVSGRSTDVWWPIEDSTTPRKSAPLSKGAISSGGIVNIDSEESLLVVRASAGSADATLGGPHLYTSVAIGRFEIEDLLVGAKCRQHKYLARSFESQSGHEDGDGEDDEFEDAAEELTQRMASGSSSRSDVFLDAEGPSELLEAQPPKVDAAWTMEFETWQPGTPDYAEVDAELRMRLTTLYFFCNRPTLGALMGIGGDLSEAFKSPQQEAQQVSSPGRSAEQQTEQPQGETESDPPSSDDASVGAGQLVLGGGIERTVFRLQVEVGQLEAGLLYEDASSSPLALAHIEDVRFNLHVHPATMRLTASLGNLRAQDGQLPEGHPFRNVCDLRRGETTSLIELEYLTHTAEESASNERVPTGLPYSSITASMHRLDVVFLSRFLFEILAYINLLLALQPAPLLVEEAAEGEPSQLQASSKQKQAQDETAVGMILELDISMEAPVITLPRNSDSQDAIEVDLGSLHLSNSVAWRNGSSVKDLKAVLLEEDVLTLEGLGARVRVDGKKGNNVIHEYDSGTHIRLQRALRDIHQVLPKIAVAIDVPSIKATLTDREYQLITSIAGDNFSEEQQLPASAEWLTNHYLELEAGGGSDAEEETVDDSAAPQLAMDRAVAQVKPQRRVSGTGASETAIRVTVNVAKSELELQYTTNEATGDLAPMARFTVRKLWLAFRSMAGGGMVLSMSVPLVEGVDLRPGLPDEHRLVITAAAGLEEESGADSEEDDVTDYKARASFLIMEFETDPVLARQKLQLRLQRPTITAETSFMLAVTKFFVPSFALSGAKPIPFRTHDLRLTETEHRADEDLWLSPELRLLADAPGVDSFVYNGQGHQIVLPEGIPARDALPLIVIGGGKVLRLQNVTLVQAASLPACLQLGPGAQLLARQEENVALIQGADPQAADEAGLEGTSPKLSTLGSKPARASGPAPHKPAGPHRRASLGTPSRSLGRSTRQVSRSQSAKAQESPLSSLQLEFVALGVGLRFVELADPEQVESQRASGSSFKQQTSKEQYSVRMLAAYLDLGGSMIMEGEQLKLDAHLKGLQLETVIDLGASSSSRPESSPGGTKVVGTVLEPVSVDVGMEMRGASGTFNLDISNIRLNLSPDILELILGLQTSVLEPLIQPAAAQPVTRCSRFVKIWGSEIEKDTESKIDTDVLAGSKGLTFWQPQPPVGYAVLGDCVTAGSAQPTFQVLAIAVNSGLVTYPTGFKRVGYADGLTLWEPKPPKGYTSVGQVAVEGEEPPPTTRVVCLHHSLATESALGECFELRHGDERTARSPNDINVWNVDNAAATFVVCSAGDGSPPGPFLTLRSPLGVTPAMLNQDPPLPSTRQVSKSTAAPAEKPNLTRSSYQLFAKTRKDLLRTSSKLRLQSRAVDFRRVWWDKGVRDASREGMSLWRPSPPTGYISLGDCLVSGYDPPKFATMLERQNSQSEEKGPAALLKPPQDYRLVWRDDSVRVDRALHIWQPAPYPGYVPVGCIGGIGEQKPARGLIRCIREDAVVGRSSVGRPLAALPATPRRLGFKAWATDDRLGTFMLTRGEEAPPRGSLRQLRILDAPQEARTGATNAERKEGMDMVVRTGRTSLLLRDALRRPLAELELGAVQASLRRPTAEVMQLYCGIHISAWSFNPNISAWEPVLESWDLIVKVDTNKGSQPAQGVEPGTHVSVKSTSEIVHVTLAYAAATTALTSLLEWRDLVSGAGGNAYKRQLAAADSSSVHTIVDNKLGVGAQLQLDFGDRVVSAEVPEGRATPVLQPLARSPSRYSEGDDVGPSPEAILPPILFVDLRNLTDCKSLLDAAATPLTPQELYVTVTLTTKQGEAGSGAAWGLRSRAVLVDAAKDRVKWHERLVLELPKGRESVALEVQLWDAAANSGQGSQLAAGSIDVDWSSWNQGAVSRKMIQLKGKDSGAELSTRLIVVRQTGREEGHSPTDKWTEEASTAGQRAIHVGRLHKGWALVPPTGLQRTVAAANKHLKQNLKGKAAAKSSSTSLSVVRIGSADGIALEGSFQDGLKKETLRSLCQVTNDTRLTLEVSVANAPEEWEQVSSPSGSRTSLASSRHSETSRRQSLAAYSNAPQDEAPVEEEVFENERFLPLRGWSSRNLLPTDRRRFSHGRNQQSSSSTTEFPKIPLADGWEWQGPWELETNGYVDKEGWTYGVDFGTLEYPPAPGNQRKALQHFVRRRRYVRRRKYAPQMQQIGRSVPDQPVEGSTEAEDVESERMILGTVEPGDNLPLPFGWRRSGRHIQVRPVIDDPDQRHHLWSSATNDSGHFIKLDSLEEGSTRLVVCNPHQKAVQQGKKPGESSKYSKLTMAKVWFSLSVEGDMLPSDGGEPLTDWRIVVAPPLVIQNQLPVQASFMVWEQFMDADNMVLRQSGEAPSGHKEHMYAVDTRHSVRLQFFPDGYSCPEGEPVLISQGFSESKAGVSGKQQLPESFKVTRNTRNGAAQDVFINREINLDSWILQGKEGQLDPGAAVAMGSPVLVRLYVPLWIVNATTLPVSGHAVPTPPPPKAASRPDSASQPELLNAAESIKLRVMEAKRPSASPRNQEGVIPAGSIEMMSFPQTQLQAFKGGERQHYGVVLKVGDSGWTEPLPLDSGAAASTGEASSKPVLIRAFVPELGATQEIVARLDLAGTGFERTLVLRLEQYCVVTNRTGVPLQLMQWRSDVAAETYDDKIGGGTMLSSSKGGLPRATTRTPQPPGMRAAVRDPEVDWTSCMDLPTGISGAPISWSRQSDKRSVCLRLTPDGTEETTTRWSHPIEVEVTGNTRKFLAIPVRQTTQPGDFKEASSKGGYLRKITTLFQPAEPIWELQGPRVATRIKHFAGNAASGSSRASQEYAVVILRYSLELRPQGCLHLVLESVSADAPFLLENRSPQALAYRQAKFPGLPFTDLPPFSAAGFAWQVPGQSQAGSSKSLDLSAATWQQSRVDHEVEIMDISSKRNYGVKYFLEPAGPQSVTEDVSQVMQHASASAEQPRLPTGDGKELQVVVRNVDQEIMERAGLQSLGTSASVGRGGQERALRIVPVVEGAPSSIPTSATEDRMANALYLTVTIIALEISLVDHTPEELMLVTIVGLDLDYAAGIGPDYNFISLRAGLNGMQIDDQLATSRFPVLLTQASVESNAAGVGQPLVQACVVCQPGGAQGQAYYPYLSFRIARPLQLAVTETLVWRVVETLQRLDLAALSERQSQQNVAASSDSPVRLSLVNMSDLAAFVSFRGDTLSRPRWAAAMGTLSWGLDMANFEGVPVRLQGFEMENVTMLWSVFVRHVLRLIRGQIVTVALSFLRNFGIFSGTSGVLGALSAGVGSLAGDKDVNVERQKERRDRDIGGFGAGVAEGGQSLASGFKRGFTGLVSKPLQGAKQAGVGGFISGVGKGLVGAVANPVSGGLDALSSTFEGIDAASSTLLGRARPQAAKRSRLPRAIGGDRKLLPFRRPPDHNEKQARIEEVGQSMLRGARDRDTSALSIVRRRNRRSSRTQDAYEDHFLLHDERVVVLTNAAITCLHAPGFAAIHAAAERGQYDSAGAPEIPVAELRWSVLWKDLLAMELTRSSKDLRFPDRVQVQRKGNPGEQEEEALAHELRCFHNTRQAETIKKVALKIRDKYYVNPQKEAHQWEHRTAGLLHKDAEARGLPPQQLPLTMPSLEYRRVWHTRKAESNATVSIWRPVGPPGYKALGDVLTLGLDPPTAPVQVYRNMPEAGDNDRSSTGELPLTAPPAEFHLVWRGVGRNPVTLWEPVPAEGYRALGTIATPALQVPSTHDVLCVRQDKCQPSAVYDSAAWQWEPPAGGLALQRMKSYYPQAWKCSLWQVDNEFNTFLAIRSLHKPPFGAGATLSA